MGILPKSKQKNCPTSTGWSGDFPARASRLLDIVEGLTIPEVRSFLTSQGLLKRSDRHVFYLKMSEDCFLTTTEGLIRPYCPPLRNWIMTRKRWFLTAGFSAKRPGKEYICSRMTGSRSLTTGKGKAKPDRFTLVSGRGLEIRTRQENKKVCEMPAELCEHLQGFPIGWTVGMPSTLRKSALGNALTPQIVNAITKNFN